MNTCVFCFGTVTESADGSLELVGEPFLPSLPHAHQTTESARTASAPVAA